MAKKTQKLLDRLTYRGPHRIDAGELGFTGMAGKVFLPHAAEVSPAPLIGLAHDWTKSPEHYVDTAKHLASWGFVVVVPAGSDGLRPDHRRAVDQLSAALENVLASTLGNGRVRADARRIGLVGHGMGAGVAGVLAGLRTDIDGVALAFPAPTEPSPVATAHLCDAAALVVSAKGGVNTDLANSLGVHWRGSSVHRRLDKASETGLVERNPILANIGLASADRRTQRAVRPLLAGFLLATVAGDDTYADFASDDPAVSIPDTIIVTPEQVEKEEQSVSGGAPPALTVLKSLTG